MAAHAGAATHARRSQRSIPTTFWAAAQIVGHVFARWRRTWRTSWGMRASEHDLALPGAEIVPDPTWQFAHAVSIDAPSERVWPWIAQIGQGRGGFYTYERLENLFGCRITNADTILAEHQSPEVGAEIRLHPESPPLRVAVVEPPRSLVLHGSAIDGGDSSAENVWAFHLIDDERTGGCRLIEEGRTVHGTSLRDRLFFSPTLIEPIGFVMSREMLRGIKERAETALQRASGAPR